MSALLTELKVRARLRLNARRDADPGLRLRDCLGLVAREVGFANWEQARKVLGGEAAPGDDMGTFWHAPRCSGLLNPWFSKLAEARAALAAATDDGPPGGTAGLAVLLPYRRQFVLAGEDRRATGPGSVPFRLRRAPTRPRPAPSIRRPPATPRRSRSWRVARRGRR